MQCSNFLFVCLFVCIAFKRRNTKEQGKNVWNWIIYPTEANLYPENAFQHSTGQVRSDSTSFASSHDQGIGRVSASGCIRCSDIDRCMNSTIRKNLWCVLLLHIQSLSKISLFQTKIKGTFNGSEAKSLSYVSFQFQKTLIIMALKRNWTGERSCDVPHQACLHRQVTGCKAAIWTQGQCEMDNVSLLQHRWSLC